MNAKAASAARMIRFARIMEAPRQISRAGREARVAGALLLNVRMRNSTFAAFRAATALENTSRMKPLGTLDELPRDYVAALAGCESRAAVAQPARAASAAGAADQHDCRALALERHPAAAAACRGADADGKGRAPRAGARQSRARPRQPAGIGDDLSRHAARPARARRRPATGTRPTPRASSSRAKAR